MKSGGFTLIELLVVLVLIGVIGSMAVLAIGNDGSEQRQRQEVERLQALLQLAEQEAELRGEAIAVELCQSAYRFFRHSNAAWRLEDRDSLFRPRQLPAGFGLLLRLDGQGQSLPAQLLPVTAGGKPQFVLAPAGAVAVEIAVQQAGTTVWLNNTGDEGWTLADETIHAD